MGDPALEVDGAEILELADKRLCLLRGDRAGEQDGVDEHAKFRVLKLPGEEPVPAVLIPVDHIAQRFQEGDVADDGSPVTGSVVRTLQVPQDVLLRKAVVLVRVLLQHPQDQNADQLLLHFLHRTGSHTHLRCLRRHRSRTAKKSQQLLYRIIIFHRVD